MTTQIQLPNSWVPDAETFVSYLQGKGYDVIGFDSLQTNVMSVEIVEDLDASQKATLRSDLLSDFNPISVA